MKRWSTLKSVWPKVISLVLCLAVLAIVQHTALGARPAGDPPPESRPEYVPGEIILKLKGASTAFRDAARTLSGQQVSTAAPVSELRVWRVKVDAGHELERLEALRKLPDVEYAELNYIAYAQETPNDPYYSLQWGLDKINAPAAWDVTHGSSSLIIAIVDTGIDGTHPDLSARVLAGYNFVSSEPIPAHTNSDDNGHGTHVAGIASAVTNNGLGVAGMAWEARMMPVKVLDPGGYGSYLGVAQGIKYAADKGAKIINLSLGGPADSITLKDGVDYAYSKGCLLVAAAGNGGTTPLLYPAQYANVMGVGNTDWYDQRYSSNYGDGLSVMAPGTSIYSTVPGSYGYKSGTSMSTPFVSGLAALVWSACSDMLRDEVRQLIEQNAVDLGVPGWDVNYGYGRIDAGATLRNASILALSSDLSYFLADVQTEPVPAVLNVDLQYAGTCSQPITWTATISTTGPSWLNILPPSTGTISSQQMSTLQLQASKPVTTGTYTSELIVIGSNGSITTTASAEIILHYVERLNRVILLPIFKGYASGN